MHKDFNVGVVTLLLSVLCMEGCKEVAAAPAPVNAKGSAFHAYVGLMGGWERMGGRRTEVVKTSVDENLFMSDNFSMKQNNLNAYGFLGVSIPIIKRSMTVTLSPEVYAGQGYGSAVLRNQKDDLVIGSPVKYRGDFRRTSSYGAVLKVGLEFLPSYTLYILGGFDKSRYQHRVDHVSDPGGAAGFHSNFSSRSKWMSAPVYGIGFEKTVSCFKVGIETRILKPSTFRHVHNVGDELNPESISVRVKPKIYSTMLRISYLF